MKRGIFPSLALAFLAAASVHAYASEQTLDIDTRFRAKIAKEKLKQEFQQRRAEQLQNRSGSNDGSAPTCGSQNIGNVDTGGQIGTSPREVFVFAPNAINLVTPNGCH